MTNENLEIASELLSQIAESAKAGSALALGPQAVQNLHGLLGDLLRKTLPDEPAASPKCEKCGTLLLKMRDGNYVFMCVCHVVTINPSEPKTEADHPWAGSKWTPEQIAAIRARGCAKHGIDNCVECNQLRATEPKAVHWPMCATWSVIGGLPCTCGLAERTGESQ